MTLPIRKGLEPNGTRNACVLGEIDVETAQKDGQTNGSKERTVNSER